MTIGTLWLSARRRARPGVLARAMRAVQLSRQRRALRELEDHRLHDLGIKPDDARREAARHFWDAPAHWRD